MMCLQLWGLGWRSRNRVNELTLEERCLHERSGAEPGNQQDTF